MGGKKNRTISRTSLTRDYNEEINSDSSSDTPSSMSSTSTDQIITVERQAKGTYYKISANEVGVNANSESIITIENFGHNMAVGVEEVLSSSADNECNQTQDESDDKSVDYVNIERNTSVSKGILSDECTDSIELTEQEVRDPNNRSEKEPEVKEFTDLWSSLSKGKNT